jgi:hypothetical protein
MALCYVNMIVEPLLFFLNLCMKNGSKNMLEKEFHHFPLKEVAISWGM